MNSQRVIQMAERLFTTPAAPYHEAGMKAEVRRIAAEQELPVMEDEFGNLLLTLANRPELPPVILAAHLDHPGFVIRRALGENGWVGEFLGGVGDDWFQRGVPLLLMPGRVSATLGQRIEGEKREFEIHAATAIGEQPQFAVWDLTEFEVAGDRLTGRACDDLAGVAAILAVLADLKERNAPVHVIGALTRAEEVGFHGALCLGASGRLPREGLIISLETSREIPPVRMGEGVILRVGDKASTFDPVATRFLAEVAEDLRKANPKFQHQRALMSGGTCEGTAYQELGYRTAAVCVALGNYHNCGEEHRIAAEYVSIEDVQGMVALLASAAESMGRYAELVGRLPKRLQILTEAARKNLQP